ncbi:MAG: NAD(P)/FAD-dependent oxidoreductase [Theionarchaea archaeon]|nr:NAD(P)/FAD-dependent oxidoreductase [Theionarchaea archaeon]
MIIIIGGGPGGYTAAIRAAQLGSEVTLIEMEEIGGCCLHWGCIPAKVFLKASKLFSQLELGKSYGVSTRPSPFDIRKLLEKKEDVRQKLTSGLKNVLRSYDVTMIHGKGVLIDQHTVRFNEDELSSEKIIVATGSRPEVPHLFEEMVLSYRDVYQLEYLPRSVMVVEGGIFSLEMAWFFRELGSQVTLLTDTFIEREFEDIKGRIELYFKNHGVRTIQGRITSIKKSDNQKIVEINGQEIMAEEVIWMNRKPVLDALPGSLIQDGRVPVNEHMQTNLPDVYAVGDITGSYLAGDAIAQGITAAEHAMGTPSVYRGTCVPKVMYAPEAAVVGLTYQQAVDQGYEVVKGSFPYGGSGRAQTIGAVQGRVTLLSDKQYGEILGAYILGKGATELIHLISFSMMMEITMRELSTLLCAHPTMMETIRDACLDVNGNSLNMPKK